MTKKQIIRAIKKNEIILANLKENMANKILSDNYQYVEDIISIEIELGRLEMMLDQFK